MDLKRPKAQSSGLSVLNELRNRGVKDILIACCDGLKGFTDAILKCISPNHYSDKYVIHQIRNSLRYAVWKDKKAFMQDLRPVYTVPRKEKALYKLDRLEAKWSKKYAMVIKSWRDNWPYLSAFFQYP